MYVIYLTLLQIAQIDLLTKLGLQPDGIIGHSVGELACGYADGSLSQSEAILAAYWRGRCIKEANLPPGGMAAVGKRGNNDFFNLLAEVIYLTVVKFRISVSSWGTWHNKKNQHLFSKVYLGTTYSCLDFVGRRSKVKRQA